MLIVSHARFLYDSRNMFQAWTLELKAIADRIISMCQKLFDALHARGEPYFISSISLVVPWSAVSLPLCITVVCIPI